MLESEANGRLEIFYENGKKVLNAPHANYSFGSLHRVFKRTFGYFKPDWKEVKQILILGYGGGSVVNLLMRQPQFNGKITAVDIDPVIRELAERHFPEELQKTELHVRGAREFLESTPMRYDLIVVDLFIDQRVPEAFTHPYFIKELKKHLNPAGRVIHNLMFDKPESGQAVINLYQQHFELVDRLELFGTNTVISARL